MQVAILLYPGVTALDAIGPYEVLRNIPHCDLRFVAHEPGPIITDSGILILGATHSFAETPTPDLVLIPGSEAAIPAVMADRVIRAWLQQAHTTSTLTLSVCSGALVLAAAGLLRGQPATTHWAAQSALATFGALPQKQQRIVRTGKIITAAGVSAGIDLALYVVGELYGKEQAEMIQLYIEYDPQPPFDAGHPSKASKSVQRAARQESLRRAFKPGTLANLTLVAWREAIHRIRERLGLPPATIRSSASENTS